MAVRVPAFPLYVVCLGAVSITMLLPASRRHDAGRLEPALVTPRWFGRPAAVSADGQPTGAVSRRRNSHAAAATSATAVPVITHAPV